MKVGCYIRVSTQEQAKEGYSIGAQTQRLKAYCTARGWDVYETYTDPAFSGAKMDRPALQKLISDVKNNKLDIVLVYKLDRLSRSQKDTLYLIEDIFMKNGVAFISVNESFDTSTAFGRAVIGMLSVFAQLEREQIKERSQMGLHERVKSGLWRGGGNTPIGYDYINGRLEVNEYEAMQIREIYDLYINKDYSLNAITKHMQSKGYKHKYGRWLEPINIRRVLTNSTYLGLQKWNDDVYKGNHEAIITKKMFDASSKRIKERAYTINEPPEKPCFGATQLLTGIIYCKNCGGRYYGKGEYRGSKKLPYSQRTYIHLYSCYSRTKTKKSMIKDPTCKNKNWKTEELDEIIKNQILKLTTNDILLKSVMSNNVKEVSTKSEIIASQIEITHKKIQKLLNLYLSEGLPRANIATMIQELEFEKKSLKNTYIEAQNTHTVNEMHIEQFKNIANTSAEVFNTGSLETQRRAVQSLIKRIDIDEEKVLIQWLF